MNKFWVIVLTVFMSFSVFADGDKKNNKADGAWENGVLYFRSGDDFSLRFDARIFLDFARYSGSDYAYNGSDLRRGRLALKTKLHKYWLAEFDMDIADNQVEAKDMWAARLIGSNSMLKIGYYKVPFSMEELTSSLIITFMERSLANSFTPGRRMSIGYNYWGNYGQISTSVFGQEIGDSKGKSGDEALGFALRGSLAYSISDIIIHLGVGAFMETTEDDTGVIKVSSRPETKVSKVKYLDTGDISDVEYNSVGNIEFALSYKFIRLQAEYMINKAFRENDKRDLSFSGFYAHLGVFLTGEIKPYSVMAGEFLPVIPKRDFGAIELALRISRLNLNDVGGDPDQEKIEGGLATQYTVGLTWFFNTNFRIMFNYSYADNSKWSDGDGDYKKNIPEEGIDLHIFQSRFIANF